MERDNVKAVMADALGIDVKDIDEQDTLREDLRIDPQVLTDLSENLKEQLGIDIPYDRVAEAETVEDFLNLAEEYAQEEIWKLRRKNRYNIQG